MSWKDLFYFTRAQRNGIIVLFILILLVAFAPAVFRSFYQSPPGDSVAFLLAVEDFEERLAAMQAAEEKENQAKTSFNRQSDNQAVLLSPFPFNPNNLPTVEWEKMGVPAYVARSIKNYENAGGRFRYKEDVSRLYLITDEIYSQLEPFIQLPSRESQTQEQALAESPSEASAAMETRTLLQVNLNTADTTELIKLYGIGPVFSRRIVNYREKLGGYRHPDQLLEVFGMDTLRLNGIRENLLVDTNLIRKININQAEWADLVRHPYINSNLANSLVAIRKQHGPYQSIADIRRSHLVTEEIFQKVSPYLTFE